MKRKLTATAVKNAKTYEKPVKLSDGGGLHLVVRKNSKSWKYSFRYEGQQQTITFGQWPEISLSDARELHQSARDKLAKGIKPSNKVTTAAVTLQAVADEWFDMKKDEWSDTHRTRVRHLLDRHLLPHMGNDKIASIEPPDILAVLKKMQDADLISSMHKAKIVVSQVLRYGVASGVCARDGTLDLKGSLKAEQKGQFAAITDPKQVKQLMVDIRQYQGSHLTRVGLEILANTFVRPGELRGATRQEFNLDKAVWSIPAERMKARKDHHVPLSRQVVEMVKYLFKTHESDYLLPSLQSKGRQMSENTLNVALRRMGYDKTQMTSHGFRAMASSRLNEMGFNPDAIEAQLAHSEKNAVRAAYNRSKYWDERVEMMQKWSDYLSA